MELAKLISEKYGNPTNSVCDIFEKEKIEKIKRDI